ncbi:putative inactive dual specificity protein phosphatase-like protein [Carex littledalei]|uniref:Putative inactive dual specificity protein phosphatase-like protein n=1 Tax=Carex littledalei TaxID=544730 RepID=A0A833R0Y3_9POAL|nr:putative inactive dual specificity protein phosphatase-like protein [Carex littledalei]
METAEKPKVIYRCKKCRRIVASEESVIPHEQGEGEQCFKWKDRDSNWSEKKPQCTAIFVEPMKWMRAVEEGNAADKLLCMGCEARLGSFNWAGMQCSCGTWVNPAFQIVKSKIDESTT